MVAFSSLKNLVDWTFTASPDDPKHQEIWHPLVAFLISNGLNWVLVSKLSDLLYNQYPQLQVQVPSWAKKYALPFMIVYWFILVGTRCQEQGPRTLYEMMWACNIAILMFVNGLVRNNVIPIASTLLLIGFDQSLWYVDLIGYLTTGKFPVGVAKYLIWPETTKIRLLTTTHHVWFMPLILMTLKNMKKYPFIIYIFTYLVSLPMSLIPRIMTPKTLNTINKAGLKEEVYLNVMLVYELWKDVKSGFFSAFDQSHPAITLAFSNQGWNACNLIIYLALYFLVPYLYKKQLKLPKLKPQ